MSAKLLLLLACLYAGSTALAADDVSVLTGRWQVDRLVTSGVERHFSHQVIVTFKEPDADSIIRGGVDQINTYSFDFKADGHRLVNAHGLRTSTTLGIRAGRAGGPPPTSDEVAAVKKLRADDEFLGTLFGENDAYWSANGSGITIGFVMADTRIELSRYSESTKHSAEP
jgi:hypothetical protein